MIVSSKTKSTTAKPEFVFAADLGGTHLRVATVDRSGKIYCRQMQPTPQAEKPNDIVRALIDAVHACARNATAQGGVLSAVSVVVPGTVNVAEGVVVKAPNVPCLDGFRLAAALESELGWWNHP